MTTEREAAGSSAATRAAGAPVPPEHRPGEVVLIPPGERRPLPAGGPGVLMLGRSVPSLMMQGFLLSDLPSVACLDPHTETDAALAALDRQPGRHDLALVIGRSDAADAVDFARRMRWQLAARAARGPFVVALAEHLEDAALRRARSAGVCAACLRLPLSKDRFEALLGRLFHG